MRHHETFKHIPLPPLVPQAPYPARIRRHRPPRTTSSPHRPRQHRPHRISRRARRHQPPAPTLRHVPQQPLFPKLHHPRRHCPHQPVWRHDSSLHTPNFTLRAAQATRTRRPRRSCRQVLEEDVSVVNPPDKQRFTLRSWGGESKIRWQVRRTCVRAAAEAAIPSYLYTINYKP